MICILLYQGATVGVGPKALLADPARPTVIRTMRTLSQIIAKAVTGFLITGVLLALRTEAICYTKDTLLPIRKPVGAELFEIDPGAEVTQNVHPRDKTQQTTCKFKNMFLIEKDI